jgi:polar amino acid transport system substrate-binding protein
MSFPTSPGRSNRKGAGPRIAAALIFGLFASALTSAHAQESRLDTIVKRNKVIVAVSSTSAPNGFIDAQGNLTGFEIEFARLIVKGLIGDPNKVEFLTVTTDGRFPAVLSGKADFGISTATIYPDRATKVAFTRPYMDSGTAVLVKANSPIKSLADLNNAKVTLSSVNSSGMVDRVKRYAPLATPLYFDGEAAAAQALRSDRANAYQTDVPIANDAVTQSKGAFVKLPGLLGNVNNNAIFMKPGDFTLWLAIDTIVGEYVSGSRYDEYAALYRKWFGSDPPPERSYPIK